ncbi:hypothetical protein AERO8C_200034 [Aeromonas veronii]|uniref:Uncharacterized protein n=1 Tax=Aeromonas veronii TaxID=654 RepID=A0A653L531_AERVE|nr:hypothetical protein AERO8C_200034 [Aeromonas veronii]
MAERRDKDHQGVGEAPEAKTDDDADGAVDALAAEQPLGDPLIAKPVDQTDGGQQGGHQQRDKADEAKQGLARHAGAGEGIGVAKGDGHYQRGDQHPEPEGVADGAPQMRGVEVGAEVGKAHPEAVLILQALLQHGEQRQQQTAGEQGNAEHQQDQLQQLIPAPATTEPLPARVMAGCRWRQQGGGHKGGSHGRSPSNSCIAPAGQCSEQRMPLRQPPCSWRGSSWVGRSTRICCGPR